MTENPPRIPLGFDVYYIRKDLHGNLGAVHSWRPLWWTDVDLNSLCRLSDEANLVAKLLAAVHRRLGLARRGRGVLMSLGRSSVFPELPLDLWRRTGSSGRDGLCDKREIWLLQLVLQVLGMPSELPCHPLIWLHG